MFLRVLIFFFCCLQFFQTVSSAQCDAQTCSIRCNIKPTNQPAPGENNMWVPILSASVGVLILVVIVFGSVLYIRSRRLQKKLLQNKLTNRRPQNSLLNEYSGSHPSPVGSTSLKQTFEVPNDYEEINYFELDNQTGAKNNKNFSTDEPESSNYYLTPYCVAKPSNPPPSVPLPLDVFKHN